MANYKIVIKNYTTQDIVSKFKYTEKTPSEAKALAYLYGRGQCAMLPDGEYVCSLYKKQFVFCHYRREHSMSDYSYKVKNGQASLSVSKIFFGGEGEAINIIISFISNYGQYASNAMSMDANHTHKIFVNLTSQLICALDNLYNMYYPEYLDTNAYQTLTCTIRLKMDNEESGYKAYKNDPELGIYQSIASESYSTIAAALSQSFCSII